MVQMLGWLSADAARASRRKLLQRLQVASDFIGKELEGNKPAQARVRVICERPYHALFMHTKSRQPSTKLRSPVLPIENSLIYYGHTPLTKASFGKEDACQTLWNACRLPITSGETTFQATRTINSSPKFALKINSGATRESLWPGFVA